MNIFKILSSGDGSIKEPNLSAFLNFLLDPNADHGLHSRFLEKFLQPLILNDPENLKDLITSKNKVIDLSGKGKFFIEIELEKSGYIDNKRKDIDLVIELREKHNDAVKYVFFIENKIREGA